ncbi:uncharacterized protein LAESUDRAFT_728283 [Laetiporus sulphureus 93-53]|uniref:Uncharacterized protein n=1 Tax=Laetiporus sulphureus 93-53 TaxID=1314785 RepID=A0A165DA04_9APHY|nr:uncharacterized protein LAESUDRAFT_728283 [Laetiporus sulphureus 93-53]KZT04411.1 hypothetical protein LAESUDRAFT_728283 [Laetiporus sulphureus 93-53]
MSNSSHVGGHSIVYLRHLLEESGNGYDITDHPLHKRFMEVVGSPRRPPPRIVLPKRKNKRLLVQSERSKEGSAMKPNRGVRRSLDVKTGPKGCVSKIRSEEGVMDGKRTHSHTEQNTAYYPVVESGTAADPEVGLDAVAKGTQTDEMGALREGRQKRWLDDVEDDESNSSDAESDMSDTLSESSNEEGLHSSHKREFTEAFDEDIDMKGLDDNVPSKKMRAEAVFGGHNEQSALPNFEASRVSGHVPVARREHDIGSTSTSSPMRSDLELPSRDASCTLWTNETSR